MVNNKHEQRDIAKLTRCLNKFLPSIQDTEANSVYRYFICNCGISVRACACKSIHRGLVAKEFAESLLFPALLILHLFLASLFDSFGPILALLLIYVGVDELAVAIVFAHPARGRRSRAGGGRARGRS